MQFHLIFNVIYMLKWYWDIMSLINILIIEEMSSEHHVGLFFSAVVSFSYILRVSIYNSDTILS